MNWAVGDGNSDRRTLLTVTEVADWLRVRPSTVYAWVARGKLPCIRVGSVIRFERKTIARWLTARRE